MKLFNKNSKPLTIVAISFSLLSPAVYADWGVGIDLNAHKKNMPYKDAEKNAIEVNAFLDILKYRGEKFNIDDGISYDFTNSNDYAIELFATSKNRGFEAKDHKTFTGMTDRKDSIDLGVRAIVNTGPLGTAVVNITKDVHASKGVEATIKLGGISPHAPHWTGKKQVRLFPVVGLRIQDKKVIDYHYGVKASEASSTRKVYKGKSAITPFIGIEAQADLTPHITIDGSLGVSKRANSIRNSSLTDDKKYDLGANIGISYWF